MTYQAGRSYPLDYARGILGDTLPKPAWYALKVPPQREGKVRAVLRERDIHSCFPEYAKSIQIRGKRHERKYPVVTRVVYAKFTAAPQWDVMKLRRIITGVYSYGDEPIAIPGDIISAIMGLPTEAEKLEAARLELLRVREGDRAVIATGPFAGFLVDVRTVLDGRVWFETLTGMKGQMDATGVERVIKDA